MSGSKSKTTDVAVTAADVSVVSPAAWSALDKTMAADLTRCGVKREHLSLVNIRKGSVIGSLQILGFVTAHGLSVRSAAPILGMSPASVARRVAEARLYRITSTLSDDALVNVPDAVEDESIAAKRERVTNESHTFTREYVETGSNKLTEALDQAIATATIARDAVALWVALTDAHTHYNYVAPPVVDVTPADGQVAVITTADTPADSTPADSTPDTSATPPADVTPGTDTPAGTDVTPADPEAPNITTRAARPNGGTDLTDLIATLRETNGVTVRDALALVRASIDLAKRAGVTADDMADAIAHESALAY